MIGRKRLIVAAGVIALVGAGCSRGPAVVAVGTLTPLDGVVEVLRPDGWEAVSEATELSPGDQVRSDAAGAARLQLAREGLVELGPSSRVRLGSAGSAELMVGSVLAEGAGLTVGVGRADIAPDSSAVFRVDRGFSTRVGSYRGSARIEALGAPVTVKPLRQVVVLAHLEPTTSTPLLVSANDAWDRRMLGGAIDLGLRVRALERGVRGRVDRQAEPAAAIAAAIPRPVSTASVDTLLRAHEVPGSKVLVSLALAAVTPGVTGVLATARSILDNVEQGASWMLIVASLKLPGSNGVLNDLSEVLAALPQLTGASPDGSPSPDGTPGSGNGPSPDPPPSGSPPCTDCPTEPPPECEAGDTACEAEKALEDIIGGFQGGGGDRDDDPSDDVLPGL